MRGLVPLLPVNAWFDPNPFFEAQVIRSYTNMRRVCVRNRAMVNSETRTGKICARAFVRLKKSCGVTQPATNESRQVKRWLLCFGAWIHQVSDIGRNLRFPAATFK